MSNEPNINGKRRRLEPGTWSMLPTLARDSGVLRSMGVAELRIYTALVLRADWGNGGRVIVRQATRPGLVEGERDNSLQGDTGLAPRNIRKAIDRLKVCGLVTGNGGSGPGHAGEFQIVTTLTKADAAIPHSGDNGGRMRPRKGGRSNAERRMYTPKIGDAGVPPLRTDRNLEEEQQHQKGEDAHGGGVLSSLDVEEEKRLAALVNRLKAIGYGTTKKRQAIVAQDAVQVEAAIDAVERAKQFGGVLNAAGLFQKFFTDGIPDAPTNTAGLVSDITLTPSQIAQQLAEAKEQEELVARQRADEKALATAAAAELKRRQDWYLALPESQIESYRQQILDDPRTPPILAQTWRAKTRIGMGLSVEIIRRFCPPISVQSKSEETAT